MNILENKPKGLVAGKARDIATKYWNWEKDLTEIIKSGDSGELLNDLNNLSDNINKILEEDETKKKQIEKILLDFLWIDSLDLLDKAIKQIQNNAEEIMTNLDTKDDTEQGKSAKQIIEDTKNEIKNKIWFNPIDFVRKNFLKIRERKKWKMEKLKYEMNNLEKFQNSRWNREYFVKQMQKDFHDATMWGRFWPFKFYGMPLKAAVNLLYTILREIPVSYNRLKEPPLKPTDVFPFVVLCILAYSVWKDILTDPGGAMAWLKQATGNGLIWAQYLWEYLTFPLEAADYVPVALDEIWKSVDAVANIIKSLANFTEQSADFVNNWIAEVNNGIDYLVDATTESWNELRIDWIIKDLSNTIQNKWLWLTQTEKDMLLEVSIQSCKEVLWTDRWNIDTDQLFEQCYSMTRWYKQWEINWISVGEWFKEYLKDIK